MISTRFGNECTIVRFCGKHTGETKSLPAVLVQVRMDDGKLRYRFAQDLKASEGLKEIDAAVDCAAPITLAENELSKAIQEAS